jgi:TonB-dependent SusC/RagA subfamily outer membrane receptor
MKINHFFLLVLVSTLVLWSCAANKTSTRSDQTPEVVDRGYDQALAKDVNQSAKTSKPNEKAPSNLSLADMLRQKSGVSVSGQGASARIRVGGISSFGPSDPLFVINGTDAGYDFSQVAGVVNPNDIISITVLKGTDAAIYGSRGGNGVIIIRTK